MTTTSTSIVSIGKAAELLQAGMVRIRNTAADLAIRPALTINGIDHYDEADVERIGDKLRERKAGQ